VRGIVVRLQAYRPQQRLSRLLVSSLRSIQDRHVVERFRQLRLALGERVEHLDGFIGASLASQNHAPVQPSLDIAWILFQVRLEPLQGLGVSVLGAEGPDLV